jgi:HTH-type transcriptional regulator/antitoxin HigA
MTAHVDVANLLPAWMQFRQLTDIAPIRDEAHYQRMVATLEALLEVAGSDESHPAMELVDVVGDLVEDYEAAHHTLPQAHGREALAFLMAQHSLRQADLPELGSQGVVSEILSGKRELNVRQIRALGERFGVSAATFL